MRWAEAAAAAAIIGATSVVLVVRLRRATPAQQRTPAPLSVLGVATIVFIIVSANILVPLLDLDALRLSVLQLIAVALIPVAFTLGVLRGGFARTAEIEDLGVWLGSGDRGSSALHAAMRETLGDPTLEVRYWTEDGATYVGEEGVPSAAPAGRQRARGRRDPPRRTPARCHRVRRLAVRRRRARASGRRRRGDRRRARASGRRAGRVRRRAPRITSEGGLGR
jgi:hypothetical protein